MRCALQGVISVIYMNNSHLTYVVIFRWFAVTRPELGLVAVLLVPIKFLRKRSCRGPSRHFHDLT